MVPTTPFRMGDSMWGDVSPLLASKTLWPMGPGFGAPWSPVSSHPILPLCGGLGCRRGAWQATLALAASPERAGWAVRRASSTLEGKRGEGADFESPQKTQQWPVGLAVPCQVLAEPLLSLAPRQDEGTWWSRWPEVTALHSQVATPGHSDFCGDTARTRKLGGTCCDRRKSFFPFAGAEPRLHACVETQPGAQNSKPKTI